MYRGGRSDQRLPSQPEYSLRTWKRKPLETSLSSMPRSSHSSASVPRASRIDFRSGVHVLPSNNDARSSTVSARCAANIAASTMFLSFS